RSDERDLVTHPGTQRDGQITPEHNAEAPPFKLVQRAGTHVFSEIRDALFVVRQYTAHQRTAHSISERQHALLLHIRRGGQHRRMLQSFSCNRMPVSQIPLISGDLHMRCNAKDARAQFFLKTVHHRQHDNQRRHAQTCAEHRHRRNERNETVATLRTLARTGVAQTNQNFVAHSVSRASKTAIVPQGASSRVLICVIGHALESRLLDFGHHSYSARSWLEFSRATHTFRPFSPSSIQVSTLCSPASMQHAAYV